MARREDPLINEIAERIIDSPLGAAVAYNLAEGRIYVKGALPWKPEGAYECRPWGNVDLSYGWAYAQDQFGCARQKDFEHALIIAADRNSYDPVLAMFDALPTWDGHRRAGYMMHWYLGAELSEYTYAVETLLLNAAMARAFHPGCKYDHMVVLKGSQGIGKSGFCRKLAMKEEFFTDTVSGIGKKEAAELTLGKWIVELSELAAMKNTQIETLKAYITRQSDDYRVSYATYAESHPRRFVLVGTTNADAFLSDMSGNRRFMPVQCSTDTKSKDVYGPGVAEEFRQLWAEVLHRFRANGWDSRVPQLVLPANVQEAAIKIQESSQVDDSWVGLIGAYLDATEPDALVCGIELLESAIGIEKSRQQRNELMRVSSIMHDCFPEWQKDGRRNTLLYGRQHVFRRTNVQPSNLSNQ